MYMGNLLREGQKFGRHSSFSFLYIHICVGAYICVCIYMYVYILYVCIYCIYVCVCACVKERFISAMLRKSSPSKFVPLIECSNMHYFTSDNSVTSGSA